LEALFSLDDGYPDHTTAWLLQLWLLDWIEVASILSTLHLPQGWFLVVFIAVYGISLPTALVFAFVEYR
jgi:hypothetical protein